MRTTSDTFFFEIRDSPIQFFTLMQPHDVTSRDYQNFVQKLSKNDVQGLVDICVLMEANSGFVGMFFVDNRMKHSSRIST